MTYVNDLDLILDYGDYNPEPNPTKKVNNAPNTSDEKKMSKIFLLADQLKAAKELSTNKLCKISNITIVITLFLLILCTSNLSIIPKEKKKALEDEVKAITAEIDRLDLALSDEMAMSECDNFSRHGSTFYLKSRLYASPKAGGKDKLFSALRKNGYGSMVQENVNANTLSSFVKEQKENNKDTIPEWLSSVVNAYEKISVGIRKG